MQLFTTKMHQVLTETLLLNTNYKTYKYETRLLF